MFTWHGRFTHQNLPGHEAVLVGPEPAGHGMHVDPSEACFRKQVHFNYIPFGRVRAAIDRVGRAATSVVRPDDVADAVGAGSAVGDRVRALVQVDRALGPGDEVDIGSSACVVPL